MVTIEQKNRISKLASLLIFVILAACSGCFLSSLNTGRPGPPKFNLWAWERPEDFSWLKNRGDIGVAYLAQTVLVNSGNVAVKKRMQSLKIPDGIYITAVTRIETGRGSQSAEFSTSQIETIAKLVASSVKSKSVRAIQIDFDAVESERVAYVELLKKTKALLPPEMPFSITAIASWCSGDSWFGDIPVDDVVPMVFDMGSDDKNIRRYLADGKDWKTARCRNSYGLANYDSIDRKSIKDRRLYFFTRRSWKQSDLKFVLGE